MNLEQIIKCDEVIEEPNRQNEDNNILSNRDEIQTQQPEIRINTGDSERIKTRSSKKTSYESIKFLLPELINGNGYVRSVRVKCSQCNQKVDTVITRKPGTQTWLAAFLLLICSFGLFCISCLPWFIDDCKDVHHTCPNCKESLGRTKFKIFD